MKRAIEVADVLPGDTVECHRLGTVITMPVARISNRLLYSPEGYCLGVGGGVELFLLDRPTPPVELPTFPTLGWLRTSAFGDRLAVWMRSTKPGSVALIAERPTARDPRHITSFTPATAVPTEALNALRLARNHHDDDMTYDFSNDAVEIVGTFLAAVDEANGGAA